jgi:hypothetical protein
MNGWEKEFSKKMESLRDQSSKCLDRFMEESLEGAFGAVSAFLSQWNFQASMPQTQPGRRSFKFAMTEDAYVLIFFRLDGLDTLECESEYWIPGHGRNSGYCANISLRNADREWGESCFHKALDGFIARFGEAEQSAAAQAQPEPVAVS